MTQIAPHWKHTEANQIYQSTNDDKNESTPVAAFGLFQSKGEAHEMRDLWTDREAKGVYRIRCFERQVRVDTILTVVHCVVIRRRVQLDLLEDAPEPEPEPEQTDIEEPVETYDDLPF